MTPFLPRGRVAPKGRRTRKARAVRGLLMSAGLLALPLCLLLWVHLGLIRDNEAASAGAWPPLPPLRSTDRLLVLSPHPDDEVLGAGGLLARANSLHLPVHVAFLTCGDGSGATRIYEDAATRNFPDAAASYIALGKLRQREAVQAAAKLGCLSSNVQFLGYPDGGTQMLWNDFWKPATPYRSPYTACTNSPYSPSSSGPVYCGSGMLRAVASQIDQFHPTIVLTTHPADTHPDHHTAYDLCAAALEQLRARPADRSWAVHTRLLAFLIHHGPWPVPGGYRPELGLAPPAALATTGAPWLTAKLSAAELRSKRQALSCYVSQLATTPRFLQSFVRANESFGMVNPVSLSIATPGKGGGASFADPVQDDLVRDLWPASDIKSLQISRTPVGVKFLLLLTGPPSPRLQYLITLHRLLPTGGVEVWSMRIMNLSRGWSDLVSSTTGNTFQLPASGSPGGLSCSLKLLPRTGESWLVDASSRAGAIVLDQTWTGTVRWTAALPTALRQNLTATGPRAIGSSISK